MRRVLRPFSHPFVPYLVSSETITLPSGKCVLVPKCSYRFSPWRGKPIADTFGGKAVLSFRGRPVFAELAILRVLQNTGWDGVWVDTFRRKFRRFLPPHKCQLPSDAQKVYEQICAANDGKMSGCFDVFAWRGKKLLFVESKRKGRDSIRPSQIRWLEAALKSGIPLKAFLVCEWETRTQVS